MRSSILRDSGRSEGDRRASGGEINMDEVEVMTGCNKLAIAAWVIVGVTWVLGIWMTVSRLGEGAVSRLGIWMTVSRLGEDDGESVRYMDDGESVR